jgi:hypothetical protein
MLLLLLLLLLLNCELSCPEVLDVSMQPTIQTTTLDMETILVHLGIMPLSYCTLRSKYRFVSNQNKRIASMIRITVVYRFRIVAG